MRSTTGDFALQRQRDIPLRNKHDAISRTSEPTSEHSVKWKFNFGESSLHWGEWCRVVARVAAGCHHGTERDEGTIKEGGSRDDSAYGQRAGRAGANRRSRQPLRGGRAPRAPALGGTAKPLRARRQRQRSDEANRLVGLAGGTRSGATDARTGSRAALGGVRGRSDPRGLRGRRRAASIGLGRRTVNQNLRLPSRS